MRSETLAWTGTIASVLGSFAVANAFFLIGYSAFLLGSVSWLLVAIVRRDKALAMLNGTFLLANIFGLINLGL